MNTPTQTKLISKLSRSKEGSTSVVFSICLFSVVLACGSAIDFVRWQNAKTEAAAIADAAALAAVSATDASESQMKAIAANSVKENSTALDLEFSGQPKFSYDAAKTEFTVELNGKIPTSLMSLAGISNVDVAVRAVAVRPSIPPVEMVLALDTTGSMADAKITALKSAAASMVTSVLKNKDAKIGIVPFANYVNVGVGRRNDRYFDVPADYMAQSSSCSTTYPEKKGCSIVTTTGTCSSTNDGVTKKYACTSSKEVCQSWGPAVKNCKNVNTAYKFSGCVGSRDEDYRARIDVEVKRYPGFLNTSCAAEILDLTNSASAAQAKINSLTASGETYLPAGLTWGWNMLNSAEPLTAAEDSEKFAAKGGLKVLVLMTDGATTLAPGTRSAGTHVLASSSVYKSVSYSQALSAELCTNIKADGIEIYTVQFDVADKDLQKLLTDCASAADKAYQAADAKELAFAFEDILNDIAEVRIAR